jgi:hypothetical protein
MIHIETLKEETPLFNEVLQAIVEGMEETDELVTAFPTKINGYDKDFVVFYFDGFFQIFGSKGEYVEIGPDNEQFYSIFMDFFNKYDERMTFDEYKEEYGAEHTKLYSGDTDWDSDEVIITNDKSLEQYLPDEIDNTYTANLDSSTPGQ